MENKNVLNFGVHDKPKFPQLLIFALQQLLAIMAATIAVPAIVGNGMSQSAALFGAGVGGMALTFGKITITEVACALILGIVTNLICSRARKNGEKENFVTSKENIEVKEERL